MRLLEAEQHVLRAAELLHLHRPKPQIAQAFAQ
jgi:hypothetical protein